MREFTQPKATPPSGGEPTPPTWNPFRKISGWINTTVLLLALLYGGALLLSRTEGFAHLVCEQLEQRTGLEFKAGRTALTATFGLVIRDVKAMVPKHPLKAGVTAERVFIRWDWGRLLLGSDSPLRELRAENADLHFALDDSGQWQPEAFRVVSTWMARRLTMDLGRYTSLVATVRSSTNAVAQAGGGELDLFAEQRMEMRNGTVHWQVVADSEIGRAEGVDLVSTRIDLPKRPITHFDLLIRTATTAQGVRMEKQRMELIDVGERELWIEGWPTNTASAILPQPPVVIRRPEPLRRPAVPALAETNAPKVAATNAAPPLPMGKPDPGPEE